MMTKTLWGWHAAYLWFVLHHQFCDCLRLVGLRDRLRCPRCRAVGTWKPHGGWLDVDDSRLVRRWLCKWCGYLLDPKGEGRCAPSRQLGVWVLRGHASVKEPTRSYGPYDDRATPQEIVTHGRGLNPWAG